MRGSITKKGSTYSIIVDIGRDKNGKRKQKWYSGYKTKKEAQIAQAKIITELESNSYINSDKILLSDYLKNWLETYAKLNLSVTTVDGYRIIIEKHIVKELGDIQLQKLQPIHIQKFYNDLLVSGRTDGKGGLSGKTVIGIYRVFRKALSQAYKLQMITKNPADFVELPKKKQYHANVLRESDIPNFLNAFKNTEIYIPVLLALILGLRRGEALGLTWKNVDFDDKTITINQSLLHTTKGYEFSTTKSETSNRNILVSDNILNELLNHKKIQNLYKNVLEEAYNDYDLVVCRQDGTPINPATFSHMFMKVLIDNELPRLRFHDLRHTNATLMLKNNIPAKIASERLDIQQ